MRSEGTAYTRAIPPVHIHGSDIIAGLAIHIAEACEPGQKIG